MYDIVFSTDDINQDQEEYIYVFDTVKVLNLYFVNNHFSKLLFRDVSMEMVALVKKARRIFGCLNVRTIRDLWHYSMCRKSYSIGIKKGFKYV